MEIWVVVETFSYNECGGCLVLKSFVNKADAEVFARQAGFDAEVEVQASYLEGI
jgi:hypothetical protein